MDFRRYLPQMSCVLALLIALVLFVELNPPADLSAGPLLPSGLSARPWRGWTSLGQPSGKSIQSAVIGMNENGRLEIFADDNSSFPTVYHKRQTALGGNFATNWDALSSGDVLAAPATINSDNWWLHVFAQSEYVGIGGTCSGFHNNISVMSQSSQNGTFGSPISLGNPVDSGSATCIDLLNPFVTWNFDGRFSLFAKGSDGALWHKWQTAVGGGWTSTWTSLGTPTPGGVGLIIGVGAQQDSRLTVVARGADMAIYQIWQQTANTETSWTSGWMSFGKPSGVNLWDPTLSSNADGRLEFFVSGDDGAIWRKWQVAPNSYWSSWGSLGRPSGVTFGSTGVPAVAKHNSGTMDVFALGSDGNIWHKWQTAPSNGWSSWEKVGKPSGVTLTNRLKLALDWQGNLMLVAIASNGSVWMNQEYSAAYLPLVRR